MPISGDTPYPIVSTTFGKLHSPPIAIPGLSTLGMGLPPYDQAHDHIVPKTSDSTKYRSQEWADSARVELGY